MTLWVWQGACISLLSTHGDFTEAGPGDEAANLFPSHYLLLRCLPNKSKLPDVQSDAGWQEIHGGLTGVQYPMHSCILQLITFPL